MPPVGTIAWLWLDSADLPAEAIPPRDEFIPDALVELERHPEQLGDDVLRDIVARGAEAAGGDHQAGPGQRGVDGGADLVGRIADGGTSGDADADGRERAPDEGGVGVHREAEQQLGADGDDFDGQRGAHRRLSGRGDGTGPCR
ncbi:MAG: hypothetical protein V9E87_12455 [Gemmatimonadales bacterium]